MSERLEAAGYGRHDACRYEVVVVSSGTPQPQLVLTFLALGLGRFRERLVQRGGVAACSRFSTLRRALAWFTTVPLTVA